jgi:uncharacterized cupredoxin-like copper-binding protein
MLQPSQQAAAARASTIRPSLKSVGRELTIVSGLALAILLAASGVILHDREPLALAVGALLGLACTRIRGGQLGFVLLTLLAADVAFFTVLATAGNLVQPTEPLALGIPAALAATSLLVLVAGITALLGRPVRAKAARWLGLGAVITVAVVLVVGVALGSAGSPATVTSGIVVRAAGQAFSQTQLAASSGEVTLTVSNSDLFWHTFTIDELGVNVYVPVGAERTVTFKAPPGSYRFYCAIPGHAALGMQGTLTVR